MFVERHIGSTKVVATKTRMEKELVFLKSLEVSAQDVTIKDDSPVPPAVQVMLRNKKRPVAGVRYSLNGREISSEELTRSYDTYIDCRRNLESWGIDLNIS